MNNPGSPANGVGGNNGIRGSEIPDGNAPIQGRETRVTYALTHEGVAKLGKLFYLDGEPFHYRARHDGV